MLDLPEFDSLPATAGLNNTQAFQLSIRHALALLPALFARGIGDRIARESGAFFPPLNFPLERTHPRPPMDRLVRWRAISLPPLENAFAIRTGRASTLP